MKALSIRQPFAWLISHGLKDIENRSWVTRYRGYVLVHASGGMTRGEYEDCVDTCHSVSRMRPFPPGTILPGLKKLERGGIVGLVEIVDCVEASTSPWFFGPRGFVLRNARPLPFVRCPGALGFFTPPPAVLDQVRGR